MAVGYIPLFVVWVFDSIYLIFYWFDLAKLDVVASCWSFFGGLLWKWSVLHYLWLGMAVASVIYK